MKILVSIKTWVETVQWFISTGMSGLEATQLKDELLCLENSLPNARLHIDRAEWGRFKNKHLAEQLTQLKDATYDADDLLRQFHDQEQRQKLEDADRISKTLKAAKDLINGSKTKIKYIQNKLDKAVAGIRGVLGPLDLNAPPVQLMPETSSCISAAEVVGRDQERDELIEKLGVTIGRKNEQDEAINLLVSSTSRGRKRLKGQSSRMTPAVQTSRIGDVSVLAIVGIGGVGKTTLAQFIYNNAQVKAHFDVRIWVCVSDLFDKNRITREIIESITRQEFNSSASLSVLQEELEENLRGKRFLLVLDDVWPTANAGWESFYAPLKQGFEGSMVLVTTRDLEVAKFLAAIKHIELQGLPIDIFWEFFKKCAFGKKNPDLYPELQGIGQSIADRLCGSPLAAKTLGRLLNMDLTEWHWRNVQNSQLWQLPHRENEILPALQLSYLYLPQELKRCFAFCSMFPKDYSFERDEIVGIWVAQGFVAPVGSMRLEDAASTYLDDLRSRFLFQTDPKFLGQSRYVMHDLIHDMAQSVSVNECFLMQDFNDQNQKKIPAHTVRHMSIEVNNESLTTMEGIHNLNKLHSLRFGARIGIEIPWFNQLSNIIYLSLKGCQLGKLPESICELNSLRYLDISHSIVHELPENFWFLYNLQYFDASSSKLHKVHTNIVNLTNLHSLMLVPAASRELSRVSGLGKLSCLRNLSYFMVGKDNGRKIGELKGMNQLSGTLSIKSIHNVKSREEAAEARLVDKQYLKALVLDWGDHKFSAVVSQYNKVLEALGAPPRIECLKVQKFGGGTSPSWFKNLPALRILELSECKRLRSVPIHFSSLQELVLYRVGAEELITTFADGAAPYSSGPTADYRMHNASSSAPCLPLTRLTNLTVNYCEKLRNVEQFLCPEHLPSIKSIDLDDCKSLVSLPVHKFVGFVHLQDLKMVDLTNLSCSREMVLPCSLRRLCIDNCPGLSLPSCLENLTSLSFLCLSGCNNVRSIPLSSLGTNKMQCLTLKGCQELSSIGGSDALSQIKHVNIDGCDKLSEVQLKFYKNELKRNQKDELLKFLGSRLYSSYRCF